jgi:hypothetical protein
MRRRQFFTVLGGAAEWPLAARAQQPGGMRRIGVLMASAADDSEHQARMAAFLQGLAQLGWNDGGNVGSRAAAMFICASVAIAKTPKLEPITLEPTAARLLTKP